MKKIAQFIVKARWGFGIAFIVLAVLGAVGSAFVKQNYDLTTYLPEDSDTSRGLAIMKEEFGLNNTVTLMLSTDNEQEISAIKADLSKIDGVLLVSTDSIKDGNALLLITMTGDEYSDETKSAIGQIKECLNSYDYVLSGNAVSNMNLERALKVEIPIIMAIAIVIIIAVLLMSSHSWFEPVIILINLLVAVLINMGSNIIFGQISYITFAVSAILQIALAMDYSIILLHSFNEKKASGLDKKDALTEALAYNMRPISSSGLTTIAGLIALLFMSFTIGFDIGIVLAKGILVSLLSVLLFMPWLIILFDKPLGKTAHKPLPLKGDGIAKFSISLRAVLPVLLVIVIVVSYLLQMNNVYIFGGWDVNSGAEEISAKFGNYSQAVVFIENEYAEDKEAQQKFIDTIGSSLFNEKGEPAFRSISSWTTLELSLDDVASNMETGDFSPVVNELLGVEEGAPTVGDLKRLWEKCGEDIYNLEITLPCLKAAISSLSGVDGLSWLKYLNIDGLFNGLADGKDTITVKRLLDIDFSAFAFIPQAKDFIEPIANTMNSLKANHDQVNEGVSLIMSDILSKDDGETLGLSGDVDIFGIVTTMLFGSGSGFKPYDFADMMSKCDYNLMDFEIEPIMIKNLIEGMAGVPVPEFLIKTFILNIINEGSVTVSDVVKFIIAQKDVEYYRDIYALIDDSAVGACMVIDAVRDIFPLLSKPMQNIIDSLKGNFIGKNYSRILLNMDMSNDGDATFENLNFIKKMANECFGFENGKTNYVAGMSMTLKDISEAFASDLRKINIVTIVSIFIIIAILFRSLLLPVILVLVIQGAIWITMGIYALAGVPIFFMSYIICICIQMGATIDYGILIASNYRHNRATMAKRSAIISAVNSAMPTIFSSGLILITSGIIIGFVSTILPIYSIGRMLGLGTVISIIMILIMLPALLYLLDRPISWLTFDGIKVFKSANASGEPVLTTSVGETVAEDAVTDTQATSIDKNASVEGGNHDLQ